MISAIESFSSCNPKENTSLLSKNFNAQVYVIVVYSTNTLVFNQISIPDACVIFTRMECSTNDFKIKNGTWRLLGILVLQKTIYLQKA